MSNFLRNFLHLSSGPQVYQTYNQCPPPDMYTPAIYSPQYGQPPRDFFHRIFQEPKHYKGPNPIKAGISKVKVALWRAFIGLPLVIWNTTLGQIFGQFPRQRVNPAAPAIDSMYSSAVTQDLTRAYLPSVNFGRNPFLAPMGLFGTNITDNRVGNFRSVFSINREHTH